MKNKCLSESPEQVLIAEIGTVFTLNGVELILEGYTNLVYLCTKADNLDYHPWACLTTPENIALFTRETLMQVLSSGNYVVK